MIEASLSDFIPFCQTRVEKVLAKYLKDSNTPAPLLQEAMAYAIYNGGKRVRPLLVYASGLALDAQLDHLDTAASAVEIIHCYSLIHDDLPAMDNADLRRGKPSCHKKFGEAMAILAGDALQALAFHVIASHNRVLSSQQKIEIIKTLGEASGLYGMAGGQALDIANTNEKLTLENLLELYQLKTGALLRASIKLGAISANTSNDNTLKSLEKYAECLGLAFQIQDDLLDIEGSAETIGKPSGLDMTNNKVTYPMFCGIDNTKEKIRELTNEALASIEIFGAKGRLLKELALYLLKRNF